MKSTSSANLFVGKQVDAGVIFRIFFSFFLTYLTYFYVLLMKKTSRKVFSCEKCFSDLKVKMCLVLWQKGWHKTSTHLFFPKIFFQNFKRRKCSGKRLFVCRFKNILNILQFAPYFCKTNYRGRNYYKYFDALATKFIIYIFLK